MLEIVEDPLEEGRVIAGRFRLERPLGEGGMGVVWAAREIAGGKVVALKFLRSERDGDPKNRARFLREARSAMAVSHPHVAKVHAVLETETGMPFLVMDLLEGDSLRTVLRRRRRLTPAECTRVFVPVSEAVEAAHALGIVHRDLKPENVFLVHGVDVRVLDFGIAKQLRTEPQGDATASASLTSTGAVLGTPQYMAPEQIFAEADLDARADVWALGVMLYECLAGHRPFDAIGLGPLIKRITVDPIRPLADAVPGLPPALCAIVDRMLSRSRDGRPSLAEVRAALGYSDAETRREPIRVAEHVMTKASPPPEHVITRAPLPPSTTVGVASRRPSFEQPSAQTSSAKPVVLAAAALVLGLAVVGAGATLTVARLRNVETPIADAAPPVTPPSSTPAPSDSAPAPEPDSPDASLAEARSDASAKSAPTGALGTAELAERARAAFVKRDGKRCLEAYDRYDLLIADSSQRSTTPESGLSETRATCMMLAGDCEGGKALFRRSRAAHGTAEGQLDLATDRAAAEHCTGDRLSPRDELRRADERLRSAARGATKASASECLRWYDSVSRLSSTVPARSPADDITSMRTVLIKNAPSCLARAGDCPSSYRVFRTELLRTRPGTPEQDIRDEYKVLTDEIGLCRGTP